MNTINSAAHLVGWAAVGLALGSAGDPQSLPQLHLSSKLTTQISSIGADLTRADHVSRLWAERCD
jgi:hypothetical protein